MKATTHAKGNSANKVPGVKAAQQSGRNQPQPNNPMQKAEEKKKAF
jgi:hypothetical protein